MANNNGVLEFNHEQVADFITELNGLINELEDDIQEAEDAKEELELVAEGTAVNEYGEYSLDIADYRNSIEFYEAIVSDLQEFLDEVDDQVKFTRDPNFKYDDQLIVEIDKLSRETNDLKKACTIDITNKEYTPFGPFERGNFLHKGSDVEQLIDHNDGTMKEWAENTNYLLNNLDDSADEVQRLHKIYFEDITLNDWKTSHDHHDGIAEYSREIHDVSHAITGILNIGTMAKLGNDYRIKKHEEEERWALEVKNKLEKVVVGQKPKKPVDLSEIGEIKGSFTESQLDSLADMSTYNPDSNSITLGKYNEGGSSYIIDAIENNSTYFSTGENIWKKINDADFSDKEIWRLNKRILDDAMSSGKKFEFSHNPNIYFEDGSFFDRELRYLEEKGYEFKEIEGVWYAIK